MRPAYALLTTFLLALTACSSDVIGVDERDNRISELDVPAPSMASPSFETFTARYYLPDALDCGGAGRCSGEAMGPLTSQAGYPGPDINFDGYTLWSRRVSGGAWIQLWNPGPDRVWGETRFYLEQPAVRVQIYAYGWWTAQLVGYNEQGIPVAWDNVDRGFQWTRVTWPRVGEPIHSFGIKSHSLSSSSTEWSYLYVTYLDDAPIEVSLDIMPGSSTNSVNSRNRGGVPVAILATAEFDATPVDPLTVTFGPGQAVEAHGRGHIEDANGDGLDDLVLHFLVSESGLTSSDTEACVSGSTFGGDQIEGCDATTVK